MRKRAERGATKRITREQAIENLRNVLLCMVDEQSSLCRVAAWRKIFCRGFAQWDRAELEQRFPTIAQGPRRVERAHQELQANDYQLHRQDIPARLLPCDIASDERSRSPCAGWDEFSDAELARFHREICGEAIEIVPGTP